MFFHKHLFNDSSIVPRFRLHYEGLGSSRGKSAAGWDLSGGLSDFENEPVLAQWLTHSPGLGSSPAVTSMFCTA
jgi:hypothetical protein